MFDSCADELIDSPQATINTKEIVYLIIVGYCCRIDEGSKKLRRTSYARTALSLNADCQAFEYLMLRPYPDEDIEYYPVSTLVNSAKVDSEDCAQPA